MPPQSQREPRCIRPEGRMRVETVKADRQLDLI